MNSEEIDTWQVNYSSSAAKQVKRLHKERPKVYSQLALLTKEIFQKGTIP